MATATGPISKVKNLASFIGERENMRNVLNYEAETLRKKMKEEGEKHKETALFAIPFSETIVKLHEQTLDNLFSGVKQHYPEHGLFLREIEIVHKEYTGGTDSLYHTNIVIQFRFHKEEFNTHWNSFSLSRLSFDDKELRFSDNSMGVCLDPRFAEKEKYEQAKVTVSNIQEQLSKLCD